MLAIGRTLMGNPELLLVDEPTEGLGPLMAKEVSKVLAEIHKAGVSILLVEHNLKVALSLASRGKVEIESMISGIDAEVCAGCQTCVPLCPAHAIDFQERLGISRVNEALCLGCGSCAAACPSGAARLKGFTSEQVLAEIDALMGA